MQQKDSGCLLVKTASEISLKSNYVEKYFLKKLRNNLYFAFRQKKVSASIRALRGRLIIDGKEQKKAAEIILKTFGVHSFAFAECFSAPSLSHIVDCSVAMAKKSFRHCKSFAVRARRNGKHAFSSHDLNVAIGAAIQKEFPGLNVNLDAPQKELFIEVYDNEFFLYSQEQVCARGLPLGVEGNVAFFFSGKKQDLLAAWLLMKRGCNIYPILKNSNSVVRLKKLAPWNAWRDFKISTEKDLSSLIVERDILALATGDEKADSVSLGSYKAFDEKFELPVLRPLLLFPKKMVFLPKELLK